MITSAEAIVESWSTKTKSVLWTVSILLGIKPDVTERQADLLFKIGILLEMLQGR